MTPRTVRSAVALAAAAGLLLTTPAHAQLFGGKRQDEAIAAIQARIAELQEAHRAALAEIATLKQAQNAARGELTAASSRVDDLEATVKSLNGTSETLASDLAAARRDLQAAQAQNRDLLDRLGRMEASAAAAAAAPAAPAASAPPRVHTVESGDTLSKIARRYYGDPNQYPKIFEANTPMIKDPDEIYPGQVLLIPE